MGYCLHCGRTGTGKCSVCDRCKDDERLRREMPERKRRAAERRAAGSDAPVMR